MPSIAPLAPVTLSVVLLATQFSRHDLVLLSWLTLLLPALLVVRRPWVPRVLQILLVLGAAEWIRTAIVLTQQRMASGQPWARMAVILGGVATVTLSSALAFRTQQLRRRYARGRGTQLPGLTGPGAAGLTRVPAGSPCETAPPV